MLDRVKCDYCSHRDSIIAHGGKTERLLVSLSGQLTAGIKKEQNESKGKRGKKRSTDALR